MSSFSKHFLLPLINMSLQCPKDLVERKGTNWVTLITSAPDVVNKLFCFHKYLMVLTVKSFQQQQRKNTLQIKAFEEIM